MTGKEGHLSLAPFLAHSSCLVNARYVRTELNREDQTLFLDGEESWGFHHSENMGFQDQS